MTLHVKNFSRCKIKGIIEKKNEKLMRLLEPTFFGVAS